MLQRHGLTVEEANEAIFDAQALLFDPDPKSRSGASARLLGYSASREQILVVILVRRSDRLGSWWGATAWPANPSDAGIYREGSRT